MENEIEVLKKKIRREISDEEVIKLQMITKEQQLEINRLKAELNCKQNIQRPGTGMFVKSQIVGPK